jgi:hypothetical protein
MSNYHRRGFTQRDQIGWAYGSEPRPHQIPGGHGAPDPNNAKPASGTNEELSRVSIKKQFDQYNP